jgi:leucine zipper transcription factor-like protein 1
LEKQLEEAKEENNKRVSETAQFQQMRKMMQSQSNKIRDLRRRLERYEPDAGDSKGDDDD